MDLAISNATLPNGLRVVLVRDPRAHDIQVTMRYGVGAADDPQGQAGIAHLVEHLMFQQVLGAESIFAKLEAHAHAFNAFTSLDATTYVTRAAPDKLDTLLAIEGVRFGFRCTSITPGVYEREREVVVNELRLRGTSPFEALQRAVFSAGHPYATRGTPASVTAITMEQACAFADAHYTPTNAVLVISGAVDADRANSALAKMVARLPRREAAPPVAVGIAPRQHTAVSAPVSEDAVLLAWPVPRDPVERARARAMWSTVTHAINAYRRRFALPIPLGGDRAEMFGLLVYRDENEAVADVLKQVREALGKRFWFARIQQAALVDTFTDFEDGSGRDQRIATDVFEGQEPNAELATELRSINTMTRADAENVMKTVFGVDRATIVEVTAEAQTRGGSRTPDREPIHDIGRRRDDVDPADAHQPAPEVVATTAQPIERTLPNGLHVVLLPATSVPTVDVRLVFRAGSADEPASARGAAAVAAYALTWRAEDYERALWLSAAGGAIDIDVTPDHAVFSTRGLDMHLDHVLSGLRDLVVDGIYPTAWAKYSLGASKRMLLHDDDEATLARVFRVARYGQGHPYVDAGSRRDRSRSLSFDDARAFRAAHFTPDNATLVIAGHFDTALATRWIDYLFASWHGTATTARGDAPAQVQPVSLAKEDTIAEAYISMTLPAIGGGRAERLVAAAMLDEIVSDVRHQLGAAYAFHAGYREQRLATSYEISGATDATRTHEAIALVRDRLAQLRADPDSAARAFVLARRRVLATLAASHGRATSLAEGITDDVSLGRPMLSAAVLSRAVQMLTIEHMPAALADLDLSRAAILMRGPTSDLDRAFAILGRTPEHIRATDTYDDDSPDEAALPDDPRSESSPRIPKTSSTMTLLPGFAVGDARGILVTGPSLSGSIGLKIENHMSIGLHLSIADLSGDRGAEIIPFGGALSIQASVGRVWGGALLGFRVEHATHPSVLGTRVYESFEAGLEAGFVALQSGQHQLAAFARYDLAAGSELGLSPLTLGIGYRFY